MPVPATSATTVDATFDHWAIEFRTSGDGCSDYGENNARPIRADATLVKFRIRGDGSYERSPLPTDRVYVSIPDLYAAAAVHPSIATAMAAVIAAVAEIAQAEGKL